MMLEVRLWARSFQNIIHILLKGLTTKYLRKYITVPLYRWWIIQQVFGDSHKRLLHKAVRTLAALDGDMAWDSPKLRRHVGMIRLWCRLVKMDRTRLPFKVLIYDMQTSLRVRGTWAREIRNILEQCNMLDYYDIDVSAVSSLNFVVNKVRTELQRLSALSWQQSLEISPKLRTYKTYKTQMVTGKYLFRYISIKQRSFYFKFRCGTFPINIELGRYRNLKIPLDNRLCNVCERHAIEDEKHFLLECSGYNILRHELFTNLTYTTLRTMKNVYIVWKKQTVN